MLDAYKIREDFPILKRRVNDNPLIYFDNAATSQKPIQVLEAIREFYENHNANVHRSFNTLSQESSELYEKAHREVANFINANTIEEVVFTNGTTGAINLVAYSLGLHELKKGDEVVLTTMEHHSNIVPWEILSKIKNFRVKFVDVNADGTLNFEKIANTLSSRTRIVCLAHVSNVTGVINDVKSVAKMTHEHDALLLVDGAQSVPHLPVDVKDLDVDLMAFSGHKMLAPTGIGVLYGRREILIKMKPFQGGGDMVKQVALNKRTGRCSFASNDLPWKFEAGTPNICGGLGLMAALEYLRHIGMENVKEHEETLAKYALHHMQELDEAKVYGPGDTVGRCGIISFNLGSTSPHDVALFLDFYGIMTRSGVHCAQPLHDSFGASSSVRASFYIYNVREEIDRFIEVLKEAK